MERPRKQIHACPVCGQPADEGHACGWHPSAQAVEQPDPAPRVEKSESPQVEISPAPRVEKSESPQVEIGQSARAPISESPRSKRSPTRRLLGKVLGQNYRVVEPLGAGGMGILYVVEHITLKKRFAAKVLTAELARHPEAAARFEAEARNASRLEHENIVSVIDYGKTEDGCVYIIMELLRGMTLQARMEQGPLSVDEVVGIVIQVCQALAAAHAAGIVHRDMKPENIFLSQRPGARPLVKVLDFGIAKARVHSLTEGRITKQGQLLGSPEYMSPEASRGDEVDARADTYAVGVMLYELLCGTVPFRDANYLKVLQMHASRPPRPPRELAPNLPEGVERLILRALEKDPRRRQPSIQKLQVELMAAMPDVAQRVLVQVQPGRAPEWLPITSAPPATAPSMLMVRGTNPAPPGPAPRAAPYQPGWREEDPTLDIRRRLGRGLLPMLWGGAAVLAATAMTLLVMKRSTVEYDVAAQQLGPAVPVTSPQSGAAAGPSTGNRIRLRIATSPPGAGARLDGKLLGRTPIDTWVPESEGRGEVELDLPGYEPTTRSVRLDRDADFRVLLRRLSPPPAATR